MRFTLATASLQRHAPRTILAILGVAVAAAMLLDMVMLSNGLRESFRQLLLSRGFQLRLAPKGTLPFDTDATIAAATDIVRVLRTNPAVTFISPVLGASIYMPRPSRTMTSVALGVDPARQGDYQVVGGQDVRAPNTMVVNAEFLSATGTRLGDTLTVASGYDLTTRTFAGARPFVITGRAQFLYMSSGQIAAALPLPTLQALGGPSRTDRVSLVMLKARSGTNIEQLRLWIEAHIPRVTAISMQTALAQFDERNSYFQQLALILGTVSLFVSFLLVTTLMTVSVNERIGEISVMRAIGISSAHIVQQIVFEGMVISLAGATCGLGLGAVTAHLLNAILSNFPGRPAALDFFLFQPKSAWTALGLLTGVGILAGIYPAWRASSLPIATTLRREAVA